MLIDDARSVFSVQDFIEERRTTLDLRAEEHRLPGLAARLRARLVSFVPGLSYGSSDFDEQSALRHVEAEVDRPTVLVIGAGDVRFDFRTGTTIVYSDVALGPLIHVIADVHDLPFADSTFDAVIGVAVLQYLPDPQRAMAQVHRVLRPRGLVYMVAPMIQQNTLGPYDFFLYTHAGLRRVMRQFEELRSGVANGPGMALGWAFAAFMTSFSEARAIRSLLNNVARMLAWPFKYADVFLSRRRGALDCASALYFFGRRAEQPISDRDIIHRYAGLNWSHPSQ